MDPIVALLVVVLLAALGAGIGVVQRRRSGRARRTRRTGAISAAELGAATLGTTATVVQFSTEYCSRCPAVRRALAGLVAESGASVAFTDVDLTRRPETAERFRVLQTPTVLVLDGAGVETARFSGAVRPDLVRTVLADLEGAPRADRT